MLQCPVAFVPPPRQCEIELRSFPIYLPSHPTHPPPLTRPQRRAIFIKCHLPSLLLKKWVY
ncbi:hypothetical protein K443DRAFT_193818 [Laccaria amethystina LaAM-08-1]|uniref:Uncharacterized protein n=1 Tax=Laccaria amethystina LaAM-08-1 TaxID=1095629 RepID=A0A0C9XSG8_9AGAR|nr:hypothetical protein K443DRAFT_193818 [Laccaria amethystina LaAM-08-1]